MSFKPLQTPKQHHNKIIHALTTGSSERVVSHIDAHTRPFTTSDHPDLLGLDATLAPALTVEEAIAEPRRNRDAARCREPMPNRASSGGPHGTPLTFWASWELQSRPRRIALLLDDVQEEYRVYAGGIIPNLVELVGAFRARCCPVVWSAWARQFDDGISNAMDRWYGARGVATKENALYVFEGEAGLEPLREIAPTPAERFEWFYHTKHLDMFWRFRGDGKSFLDEKLKDCGVDTVVIAGLWTDECIIATAYAALSRGYDVVVVGDAVATATAHQATALTVMNASCAKVLTTDAVVDYMRAECVLAEVGAFKGAGCADGRK